MEKNPVCGTRVWPLADWVKNLLEKKWPLVCQTVGMASGGLKYGPMKLQVQSMKPLASIFLKIPYYLRISVPLAVSV